MTVRVGINGFGRIGRNFFRAAKRARRRHRLRGGERPRLARHDGAPPQVRLGARHAARQDQGDQGRASRSATTRCRCCQERNPADLPWGDLGVDVVDRVDRLLHRSRRRRRCTSTAARRSSSCRPRRPVPTRTFVYGVNHKDFDPKTAQGDLQRELHHQLLRARWSRCSTTRSASSNGLMTDDPRVHRRPAARRRSALRPASCPRRGDQHRAHSAPAPPVRRRS